MANRDYKIEALEHGGYVVSTQGIHDRMGARYPSTSRATTTLEEALYFVRELELPKNPGDAIFSELGQVRQGFTVTSKEQLQAIVDLWPDIIGKTVNEAEEAIEKCLR